MRRVKKSKPGQSSAPIISAPEMFRRMEQQRELALSMKKRALQMYDEALVMSGKCRSRIRLT